MRQLPVPHCATVLGVGLVQGSPQPPQSVLELCVSTQRPPQQVPCGQVLTEHVPPSALSQLKLPRVL